jgi:Tfp pilus assembly protein PilO
MNASFNLDKIKPYLLPIITAVVVIILVPLVILPWFNNAQTNLGTVSTQNTKLSALQTKADMLSKMDTITNTQVLNQKVEPAIPSQADPAGALGTLEQVAIASGATAKGVHFGQATTVSAAGAAKANTVAAALSVQGSYASIFDFISHSETVSRVISLTSMHIVPSGDANGTLVASFDAVAPYQPVPTNLGLAEDPLPVRTDAKTKILTVINSLHQASYAPTPDTAITGRPSPF